MYISEIHAENFKSFSKIDLKLNNFNILIGSNSSGKTNVIELFRFLRDIAAVGLSNAISLQGGVDYLKNHYLDKNFSIFEVKFKVKGIYKKKLGDDKNILAKPLELTYRIKINYSNPESVTKEEEIKLVLSFSKKKKILGSGFIKVFNRKDKITTETYVPKMINVSPEDLSRESIRKGIRIRKNDSILSFPWYVFLFDFNIDILDDFARFSNNISIYDFDPKVSKKAVQITGKAELEEDAKNLALIIKDILETKPSREKLIRYLNSILPYIKDIDIKKMYDKSLSFAVRENFVKTMDIPASFISDGTTNIIAIIIGLFFDKSKITLIEEPERNLHPSLISKLIELMYIASKEKQIVITTHNPVLLRNVESKDIKIVKRDKSGYSVIEGTHNNKQISHFLKNEIGIDDLFIDGILN